MINLFNPLNAELNPICNVLALLGAHHIFHVSVLRVKKAFILQNIQLEILQGFVNNQLKRMCKGAALIYGAVYPFSCGMKLGETTQHLEDSRLWVQNLKPVTYEHKTVQLISLFYFVIPITSECRFQWPRGLRRRSAAARLLRSCVRIPPGAWMFVCYE